jgi:sulfate/thiosulfate transport system permease protein
VSAVPAADPRTVAGDLDASARAPTDGRARAVQGNDARADPAWVRWTIIGIAVGFLGVFIVLPLVTVFAQALSKGVGAYWAALVDADTLHAVYLTLVTAVISVALNLSFGVVAAWAITKFEFRGKSFLIALIDLPFSVSPVIAGLVFVLLFGLQGVFGPWLAAHDVKIIFALPGIVLVTVFVTFPFVVRELIPLMQEQGTEEEEAALSLGASGLRTFIRVTLPNVKWALLYGVLLCNARAMGEFGAVSVVSGHIRGETNTMPLHIEALYDGYQAAAAFAVASLLALLAIVTLIAKAVLESRVTRE